MNFEHERSLVRTKGAVQVWIPVTVALLVAGLIQGPYIFFVMGVGVLLSILWGGTRYLFSVRPQLKRIDQMEKLLAYLDTPDYLPVRERYPVNEDFIRAFLLQESHDEVWALISVALTKANKPHIYFVYRREAMRDALAKINELYIKTEDKRNERG